MNPFLYKELRAFRFGRALLYNLTLVAAAVGIKSMNAALAAFFFLYSSCIQAALVNDGLGNIYIFLTGKGIVRITRERVLARLAMLCLQTVPGMIAAAVCFFPAFLPSIVLLIALVYTNGLFFAAVIYRKGAARFAAGLLQAVLLGLCVFALFYPFPDPLWKVLIILCLIPVDYSAAVCFLKKVTLEEIITAKGRES